MKNLNDLSQLDPSLLQLSTSPAPQKPAPRPPKNPKRAPAPAPDAPPPPPPPTVPDPRVPILQSRVRELEALNDSLRAQNRVNQTALSLLADSKTSEKQSAATRIQALEAALADAQTALSSLAAERDELSAALSRIRSLPRPPPPPPPASLLLPPTDFPEAFPGEIREHLLEILASALESVPPRSRRRDILSAVLADPRNAPSGALDRLRAELLHLLQSITSAPKSSTLERLKTLGVSCVEGSSEFKLRFASARYSLPRIPTATRSFRASAPDILARFL